MAALWTKTTLVRMLMLMSHPVYIHLLTRHQHKGQFNGFNIWPTFLQQKLKKMLAATPMLRGGHQNGVNIRSTFDPTISRISIARNWQREPGLMCVIMLLFNKFWTHCSNGFNRIQHFRKQRQLWSDVEWSLNQFNIVSIPFQQFSTRLTIRRSIFISTIFNTFNNCEDQSFNFISFHFRSSYKTYSINIILTFNNVGLSVQTISTFVSTNVNEHWSKHWNLAGLKKMKKIPFSHDYAYVTPSSHCLYLRLC